MLGDIDMALPFTRNCLLKQLFFLFFIFKLQESSTGVKVRMTPRIRDNYDSWLFFVFIF